MNSQGRAPGEVEERKEEVRRAGSKTSPSASVQCEPRAAAKQTVVWRTEKEKLAGCGMPLGGVPIYNKGEATEERKILLKILLKPN